MCKMKVKADLTPNYMAAAKRMIEKLGMKTSGVASPQELQEKLTKSLKAPVAAEFTEFTVVRDGKAPRFVFRENGEIMFISAKGQESFLFTGSDGAGFVQYEAKLAPGTKEFRPVFIFYSDPNGSVEREGKDARAVPDEELKGTLLSALAAMELLNSFRKNAATAILLTGMAMK